MLCWQMQSWEEMDALLGSIVGNARAKKLYYVPYRAFVGFLREQVWERAFEIMKR